ncbi:ATP-dependent zinc metalloprotease FtsH [Rhodopila globiformis]|uniref:ATP-dependent zinc metalloprotease FtsH n=1 Tax=Rhodopila globiformis TaxID=1071 RepID=A0A2S6N8H8_RHOGL|nr:ATP-dependent zinc metalloprotease FtsH [Rhodopila globiformis]PPQ30925.1 cell division protein FtsH [Rhodopila globiformis]
MSDSPVTFNSNHRRARKHAHPAEQDRAWGGGPVARLRRFLARHRDRGGLRRPDGRKPSGPEVRAHVWYWFAAFLALMIFQVWMAAQSKVADIPYSDFLQLVREHKVASAEVEGSRLYGTLKQPGPHGRRLIATTAVPEALAKQLEAGGVQFTGVVPNHFWSDILSWVLPLLILYGFWTFAFRRYAQRFGAGGGLMTIGRSRAKVYVETEVGTRFSDVAGADEAKEELREIIAFLQDPDGYGRLGAHVPKGVLLVGPPGTGKTLLARAVAGEAGVPFFSISGAEFVEMFVGVGAARVRDLFHQAHEKAPAIVFIDELDALGRARGAYGLGGHDEKEQTLNQLLVELDGFDPRAGVVLLAATNRPEVLDPALLRAGRFDRQVLVDRPDKPARAAILALYLKRVRATPDVQPDRVAELTPGLTGADLANLINEAALLATRRRAERIEMSDINEAIERAVAGLERRTRLLNPEERRRVAYHELGHALVALSVPGADPVHKVSIIPRGVGALGYTIQRPTDDRFLIRREELEDRMAVLLGGRAAEQLVLRSISTGAADDLQKATDIARAMVTRYGMIEEVGPVALERESRPFLAGGGGPEALQPRPGLSEATAAAIDRHVRDLVRQALERAEGILRDRRSAMERAADVLLRTETLSGEELTSLVAAETAQACAAAENG